MHDHIITGYDGSKVSAAAATWAAGEALRRNAALTVFGCYAVPVSSDFSVSSALHLSVETGVLRDATQARLDELANELAQSHPGLAVNASAVYGRPHRQLVEHAREADLLVVGSIGTSDTPGSLMGSVTRAVVRNGPCPVVVVPGEHTMSELPHVVVGVDGGVRSAAALEWAIDEADLLRGRLVIVHTFSYPYGDDRHSPRAARDLLQVDAACHLEEAVDQARTRGGAPVDGHLAEGRAATVIVESASGADLIVVGTRRGTGGLHFTVLGSVAEAVISHAPCPVAVVREGLGADQV